MHIVAGEVERLQVKVREVEQQKAGLQLELKTQRDELEVSFRQERVEIAAVYEEHIRALEETAAQAERKIRDMVHGVSYMVG